jgi:signal transduction histidine kinase
VLGVEAESRNRLAIEPKEWDSPLRWGLRCLGIVTSVVAVGLATGAWALAIAATVVMIVFGSVCQIAERNGPLASGPRRKVWQAVAIVSIFIAVTMAQIFPLLCVMHGGESGWFMAALLLVNSVLSIILNSAFYRGVWATPAALPILGLLVLPLFPVSEAAAPAWAQAVAVYLTMTGLLTSLIQTFMDQRRKISDLHKAMHAAERGRHAAENGRLQAENAARGKADFMVMMSHELRTPLNAVIGYSEMLYEDLAADGHTVVAEDSRRINVAGRQLLDMIEQIFDLTDDDHDQICVTPAKLNFADVALDAARTASAQARVNANTFKLNIDEDVGDGVSDAGKIRQCLAHLLSNACKFTSSGAITLEVRRCADGRTVEFAVTDTGVGIAPEKIPELFTPFHQGESGFTRSFGGAGLGLAHARRLAHAIGGDIVVESALGIGSAFALRVPCAHFQVQNAANAA